MAIRQNTPSSAASSPRQSRAQRHRPQPSQSDSDQPTIGMSPASRYIHNLKVLRRRDPSILSIFDQFSHVCVYHHNGKKWEKQGFEGSMFLYERDSYPPYGFYILNRMGMDDYIQRLYPEDDIGAHGSYLMLRSYPDFTNRRLAAAKASSTDSISKFSSVFGIPNLDKLRDKGESQTVGLWMFATDAREPMIDVMIRLHSYIKRNIPYPEDFRYGPDKPPPPNPHLQTSSVSPAPSTRDVHADSRTSNTNLPPTSHTKGGQGHFSDNHPSQSYTNGGSSELDKLFSKLGPVSSTADVPETTSKMTVESLFAALGGGELTKVDTETESRATPLHSDATANLLSSIFASASTTSTNTQATNGSPFVFPPSVPHSQQTSVQPPLQPENITILSPTPASSAPPQILNEDVIFTLLGLPPSRAASAASTSPSIGAWSHPSSREGDNEYDEDRLVGDQASDESASESPGGIGSHFPSGHEYLGVRGQINGDATPRAPLERLIPSSSLERSHSNSTIRSTFQKGAEAPCQLESSLSSSTIRGSRGVTSSNGGRPLIPFEADSELWPYPRVQHNGHGEDASEDGDIVELDFEDTSALSDPDVFNQVLQNKGKRNGKLPRPEEPVAPRKEKVNGKPRKKGRKERAADREREREEIEKSWDFPATSRIPLVPTSPPATPSPRSSPEPSPAPSVRPTNAPTTSAHPHIVSQPARAPNAPSRLDPEATKRSLLNGISSRVQQPVLERQDFVRQVLRLIHNDESFVDALWSDYTARL
ncbi:hypothetical protein BD779DRAFT_1675290 [Infundibulicybe gibba]|nr:hypothetical protein BD779DRAFT_1675290 [Infundibulicybe gibba]